jgi:hypothetical protein
MVAGSLGVSLQEAAERYFREFLVTLPVLTATEFTVSQFLQKTQRLPTIKAMHAGSSPHLSALPELHWKSWVIEDPISGGDQRYASALLCDTTPSVDTLYMFPPVGSRP